MTGFPFGRGSERLGPAIADRPRGTPRKVVTASDHQARFGEHLDRTRLCRSELGIHYNALCALVILVVRRRFGSGPTSRATVDATLRAEEGFTVSHALIELRMQRLAVEVGKVGQVMYWEATPEAERRVMKWAGWEATRGAAE